MASEIKISFESNHRGFLIAKFLDGYGQPCSLQESSNIEPNIWLGCDKGTHHDDGECTARMHLTPEHAKALLPHLLRFAFTGALRVEERDD